MAGRELRHRLGQVIAVDRGEQPVVVRVDDTEIDLRHRLDAGRATVVVDAQPLRDHGHPRVEAAVAGEPRHRTHGADEGVLCEFLGRVGVADAALAVLLQAGVVAPVELLEGRLVASLEAQHEHAVAIQVDRTWIVDLSARNATVWPSRRRTRRQWPGPA